MTRKEFEQIVADGVDAIPEKFRKRLKNVAFLVESEPSDEVRVKEGLNDNETLFGLYAGTPFTERGDFYGVGPTVPDTIIIYQSPIEEEADGKEEAIRRITYDTVWHEVGHYLGLGENEVERRERERGVK